MNHLGKLKTKTVILIKGILAFLWKHKITVGISFFIVLVLLFFTFGCAPLNLCDKILYKNCFLIYLSTGDLSNFLSDLLTIQGVIAGIAFPIITQTIANVTEKLWDDDLVNEFEQEPSYKYMKYILFICIGIVLVLKVINNSLSITLNRWIFVFVGLYSIVNTYAFFSFIKITFKYTKLDLDFVKDKFFNKARDKIENPYSNRKLKDPKYYTEKIGSILKYKIRNWNGNFARSFIDLIYSLLTSILELKKKDQNRFETFIFDDWFLNQYRNLRAKGNTQTDESQNLDDPEVGDKETMDGLKRDIAWRLFFDPNRQVQWFTQFIKLFRDFWYDADNVKDKKTCERVEGRFYDLLIKLSSDKEDFDLNELFLGSLLDTYWGLTNYVILKRNKNSIVSFAFSPYISSVFWISRWEFNILYLEKFDQYLMSNLFKIIKSDNYEVYKDIIWSLHHWIGINTSYGRHSIDSEIFWYNQATTQIIFPLVEQFSRLEENAFEKKDLQEANMIIDKLNDIAKEHNIEEEKIQLLWDFYKNVEDKYKFNNLIQLIFCLFAYIIFQEVNKKWNNNTTDYIRYLLYAKQYHTPEGTSTHWIGHKIIPSNDLLVKSFLINKDSRNKFFHEDHNDLSIYYDITLIMLTSWTWSLSLNYNNFTEAELSNLKFYLEKIKEKIQNGTYLRLANHKIFAYMLEKDEEGTTNFLDNQMITNIDSVIAGIAEHKDDYLVSAPLSTERISEFKEWVLKWFNENSIMQHICNITKNLEIRQDWKKYWLNNLFDKWAFIDERDVIYPNPWSDYWRGIWRGHDEIIYNKIKKNLKKVSIKNIAKTIEELEGDFVILTDYKLLYDMFEKNDNYTPKWKLWEYTNSYFDKEISGIYSVRDRKVPVYIMQWIENGTMILIPLNQINITYYKPQTGIQQDELYGDWILSIAILNYRAPENEAILTDMLSNWPNRLKDMGDEAQQKNYLWQNVNIRIYFDLEVELDADFKWYIFK